MAKRATKRKNLFGFKKKETYHARIVRTGESSVAKPKRKGIRYRGVRLIPLSGGRYTTSIDRDSHFDDLATAKAFVRSWKNPARKPVSEITDRAKRYRANAEENKPGPPNWCGFCGSRKVEVHHITGNESDGAPGNLMWACRPCNTSVGSRMKKAGLGKLTNQYNPSKSATKQTMASYGAAIKVMRGQFPGDVAKAVRVIRDTPPEIRSAYTARTWKSRKGIYGPSGRGNPAKFDRCVSKVKKSLKKAKRPGNAYAICSKTRNPETHTVLKSKGWRLIDSFKSRSTAEAAAANYKPYRLISRSGQWEVWTRQGARNPATLVWNASQGHATADVYMMKMSGADRFEIDVANDSDKHTYKAGSLDSAKAIARQKLHEFASNPKKQPSVIPGADYAVTLVKAGQRVAKGVTKAGKDLIKKISRKKNPLDVATKRYEEFHGLPVNEVIEIKTKEHRHSVTYGIGQLVCLEVIDPNGRNLPPLIAPGFTYKQDYWDFNPKTPADKIVWLTSGEDNKQLLLDGGDQSLDLKALGFSERDYHDHMLIGTIVRVWYRTKKKFEGDDEVDFRHDFGKEGSKGILPVLNYRPKNPSLEIAGGRYEIALPDKSLGNVSPGIVG
jgi:5-methylcytosine-specific restriction endonuclease McrA